MVCPNPHVCVRTLEDPEDYRFIEIFTWAGCFATEYAPKSVEALWQEIEGLCEPRGGRPGVEFTDARMLTPKIPEPADEEPNVRSPVDGARILWVIECSRKANVYLGISTSDGSYWRYHHRRIKPAREKDRKDLDELMETWKKLGTKIEDFTRK